MSRERVFSAVRAALGAARNDAARTQAARAHLTTPARHPLPQIARLEGDALRRRFEDQLTAKGCDVVAVASAGDMPAAVAAYLDRQGLERMVRAGIGVFAELPWSGAGVEVRRGAAQAGDVAGLSVAEAGIAETGTLLLASGPQNPVTIALLPDVHLVAVAACDLCCSIEEAIGRVRASPGGLPRSVNLISGPSRTGDIGGRIVVGAHGPRRLCVFIVG